MRYGHAFKDHVQKKKGEAMGRLQIRVYQYWLYISIFFLNKFDVFWALILKEWRQDIWFFGLSNLKSRRNVLHGAAKGPWEHAGRRQETLEESMSESLCLDSWPSNFWARLYRCPTPAIWLGQLQRSDALRRSQGSPLPQPHPGPSTLTNCWGNRPTDNSKLASDIKEPFRHRMAVLQYRAWYTWSNLPAAFQLHHTSTHRHDP